jgi:nitric oxide reductase activation protein
MWLFGRLNNGDYLAEKSQRLINYVLRKGVYNDFSFNGVHANLERQMRPIMEAPFSEEQLARAKEMMERMEQRELPDLPTIAASRLYPR